MRASLLSIIVLAMLFSFAFAKETKKLSELIKAGYEIKIGVIGPGGTIMVQKGASAYICITSSKEMTRQEIVEIGSIECTSIVE